MKRRRVILMIAGIALAVVVVFLVWPAEPEPEPEYQGKKLSEWIRGGYRERTSLTIDPDLQSRIDAVRAIGTNALPLFVRWINVKHPVQDRLDRTIERSSHMLWDTWCAFRYRKYIRGVEAMWGFEILGPQASPAIPELVRLMRSTNTFAAQAAVFALDDIGYEATPVLLGVLTNRGAYLTNPEVTLIGTMGHLGTNRHSVVPALTRSLTNDDPKVAATAAALLGTVGADAEAVVRALAEATESSDEHIRYSAVFALRNFQGQGRVAVPALMRRLTDASESVRSSATNSLREIAPEVFEKTMGNPSP